jgi:hypothetical protein
LCAGRLSGTGYVAYAVTRRFAFSGKGCGASLQEIASIGMTVDTNRNSHRTVTELDKF